jgi:gamma-glutamylcyclotransferase (GGCT)/AIG2-like uncharacterized protein YtfP
MSLLPSLLPEVFSISWSGCERKSGDPPASVLLLNCRQLTPTHPSERTSPMQQKFEAATNANYKSSTKIPYKPSLWFFYGTLMDLEILQSVLGLPELPVLQKGRIHGFKIRMWGVYATLVSGDRCEVEGMVYKIESVLQFVRLEEYETSAYRWCFCTIEMDDGALL